MQPWESDRTPSPQFGEARIEVNSRIAAFAK
jgi:hypothetical protein